MKKCPQCNRDFPAHLINRMVSNEGSFYSCPLCALEYGNKMHGINRTDFTGTIASQLLAEAREFINKTG